MTIDDIIIGAGAAGATLAARLSEDPGRQVLMVEAGKDFTGAEAADHLHGINFALTQRDWGLSATVAPGRILDYAQGRAVGGGSAVNGGLFLRGMPQDYDGWAARGNDQWSWEALLPSLRRLEHDRQYGGALHGQEGPMPVTRWGRDELVPMQQGFLDACRALGFGWSDDMNDPTATGVAAYTMNRIGDLRVSTAMAYLEPARSRPNLEIRAGTHAVRIVFEGGRAAGVELDTDGRLEAVSAGRVICCAGALQSPALLWRSGIGPGDALARLGITCRVDNPAVGANLMEHPGTFLFVIPDDGACDPSGPQYQLGLRYSAPGSDAPNDMLLSMMNFWDLSASPDFQQVVGAPMIFAITCGVHQPRSRGQLTLSSADHRDAPVIDLNLLSDPTDLAQLRSGLRLCRDVATSEGLVRFGRGIALLEDAAFDDDDALDAYIRSMVAPWYHVSGTCSMGPSVETGAVVDQRLAVHGVDGLVVADASVFPMIPRAPTNLTTIAVAERAAELLA